MRPARIALALAVAALPAAPVALEWGARAGAGYTRDDRAAPGTRTVTTPRLDVDLGLTLRDFVYQPDALVWSGAVDYRRLTVGGDADTVENGLAYRLQATAFPVATSPLSFTAQAARHEGDGTGAGIDYGAITTSYGGNLAFRLRNVPLLEASYSRTETEVSSSLRPDSFATRDVFTASTAHSGAIYGLTAGYRATLSDGTYDSDHFNEHRVDLSTTVRLAPHTQLQLSDAFYRRDPTADSPFNPRQELNIAVANLRLGRPPGTNEPEQRISYGYSTARTETLDSLESRAYNDLRYQVDVPLVPQRWYLTGQAGATLDQRTRNAVREQLAGQSLGATLALRQERPDRATELHAGPTVGVLQPFDGTVEYGFGANAGASYRRMLSYMNWAAQYGVSYADAVGAPGTSFYQQANVNLESAAGLGRLRGSLLADSNRTNDRLFGSRASRSLLLRAEYALRLSSAWLDASVRDGLTAALRTTINGDGLLIGPSYDVHVRSVAMGARAAVGALYGSTSLRLSSSDSPDRPAQDDLELRGEIGVRVGAFGMSVEDRYITALEASGARGTINVFYFRIYRVFGSGR